MNIEEEMKRILQLTADTIVHTETTCVIELVENILRINEQGGIIYTFGNGGSASNASHFCSDFLKDVSVGCSNRFRIICLNDNVPAMLAIANDCSYDDIFQEQLKNFISPKDLVIAFSCSGNSRNVVNALEFARKIGTKTVVFCGYDGGKAKQIADLAIHVPINDMEVSENVHYALCHCIKRIVIMLQNE